MGPQTGGSPHSLRLRNQERLLSLLLDRGAMHRAELARSAGVSRTTVSTIAEELLERGVIVEAPRASAAGADGRAREFLDIAPGAGVVGGLNLTAEGGWAQLAALTGEPLAGEDIEIAAGDDWETRVRSGRDLLGRLMDGVGLDRGALIGVGVGVPGLVARDTGTVMITRPTHPWSGVAVTTELTRVFDAPVFVDSGTRLEAAAEARRGAGRDSAHLLYLALSTDIGGGLLTGGRLYRGALGGAGALGHVSADPNGPACPCGNRGCLTQYASLTAVRAALRPVFGHDPTAEEVLRATADGDRACANLLTEVGGVLGRTLAGVCNLLNPELIVVGGELSRAGEVLLGPMADALRRYALPLNNRADVVPARLDPGARPGALGGAALVLQETPDLAAALMGAGHAPEARSQRGDRA